MMKKAVLAVIVLLSLAAAPALAASFEEGQLWRYQTRPGEEASRLFIARIDRGLGTQSLYHIYVAGLKLKKLPYATPEKPRVGKEGASTCRTRRSPYH